MKKLNRFALYALASPFIAVGASSVLAQQPAGQGTDDYQQSSSQRDQGSTKTNPGAMQPGTPSSQRYDQPDSENGDFVGSAPVNGMKASNLIGANVKTRSDENVGPVDDLIIDQDGQIRAIIVGVGGFLGMGKKDVAIGWKHVTRSGTADDQQLRIDLTREQLRAAPEIAMAY